MLKLYVKSGHYIFVRFSRVLDLYGDWWRGNGSLVTMPQSD